MIRDPKTGRLIVSDLTPSHKDKDTGVHGAGSDTLATDADIVAYAVPLTLFDAHTILYATTDDTPAALTVTEQTLVGRLTDGNIAAIALGIADNNILQVDGSPNANEYARFTANGLEGRIESEFKADFNLEIGTDVLAQQTIGIADDNLLEVDGTPLDGEAAVFTANGINGLSEAEFKEAFNLESGVDYQPYDATLTSIALLGTAANKIAYTTDVDTWAEAAITAAGRAMVAAADAAAQLALLSGNAGAAFDWNGQNLTNLGSLGAHTLAGTLTTMAAQIIDMQNSGIFFITTSGGSGNTIRSTNDNTAGPALTFQHYRDNPADNDQVGYIYFMGYDSGDNETLYGEIFCRATDVTDTEEDGQYRFFLLLNGTRTKVLEIDADGLDVESNIIVPEYIQQTEMTAPGAGAANTVRQYAVVGGDTLTDHCDVFQDGTVVTISEESTPEDSPLFKQPSGTEVKIKQFKPHPGLIDIAVEYPDGKTFSLKKIEYHDAGKIAVNTGCDSPDLPDGWEVTTLQERVDKQLAILDKRLNELLVSRAKSETRLAQIPDDIKVAKRIKDTEKKQKELDRLNEEENSIKDNISMIDTEISELIEKKQLELERTH